MQGSSFNETATPMRGVLAHHLLLNEFIHRSANDFAVACAEVHVAARDVVAPAAHDRLAIVVERLQALASIQRLLQPRSEPVIDLGNALCELCHYHAQARFAEQGVFVCLRASDVLIDAERGWVILVIVSELLTNAARHAFHEPGGLVHVSVARSGRELICAVRDDGVGIRSARAKARTGTAIIAELARVAQIEFRRRPCAVGAMFELRMPCDVAAPL